MPVVPTYPGVYVEEVPSLVRTIVGVPTAVTAFIGYTKRGPTDQAIQLFSYGDYERVFGGLDIDSPVGYAVQNFFQNGGQEAWVVRVANGAAAANVELENVNNAATLRIEAATGGGWGNAVRLDVDYDSVNPDDLFNMTVAEYVDVGGVSQPQNLETHRNLSMNPESATYVVDMLRANSRLIRATALGVPIGASVASSISAPIPTAGFAMSTSNNKLNVWVNGTGPFEITIPPPSSGTVVNRINAIAGSIATEVKNLGFASVSGSAAVAGAGFRQITISETSNALDSSIRFGPAETNDASVLLRLGAAQGGREFDAARILRPMPTGTLSDPAKDLRTLSATAREGLAGDDLTVTIHRGTGSVSVPGGVEAWPATGPAPQNLFEIAANLQSNLRVKTNDTDLLELGGVVVETTAAGRLRVVVGAFPSSWIQFDNLNGDPATVLGLRAADAIENVAHYELGVGPNNLFQGDSDPGSDGTIPQPLDFIGSENNKTGLYALENVDIFNILCIPGADDPTVVSKGMSYCERRRAFYIVDIPSATDTLTEAREWITDPNRPKSKNAAAYFPRVLVRDPLQNNRVVPMSASGMIAGLYSRTDAQRGVWKAPAGTDASLRGVAGTDYKLSDLENGDINPLGLNAIRSMPVYGYVSWGARTLEGSDQKASEWKYIPVRRLALYIEETLFRGTKWVVFEPNDEPLWSQIRLNVGSFMHDLFRQQAFQGSSPREAYLVKCDSETTTQSDINRGIVNMVVGFAPLKPAEFVILKISQLAGQIEA